MGSEMCIRDRLLIWSTDIRIYSEESYKGRIRGVSYSGFLSWQCFVIQLIGAIGLSLGGLLTLILHFFVPSDDALNCFEFLVLCIHSTILIPESRKVSV